MVILLWPNSRSYRRIGTTISFPLTGERVSLGRSTANELCYPEDTGLSRQHLILERHGDQWNLRDPGSKNGTLLNGERISEDRILRPGDRILAGHLAIVYDGPVRAGADKTVVFSKAGSRSTTRRQRFPQASKAWSRARNLRPFGRILSPRVTSVRSSRPAGNSRAIYHSISCSISSWISLLSQ